jgi:hypothetical protein
MEAIDVAPYEKEREKLKDMVICLQGSFDEHGSEFEQLCSDLLSCIYIL